MKPALTVLAVLVWLLAPPAADAQSAPRQQLAHSADHDAHAQHRAAAAGTRRYERSLRSYRIPDVTLLDMSGARVALASALGGDTPVFMNFIFTSCTSICPVMSATFAEVQRQLGTDGNRVRMISISIDPEHDNPQRLSAFARKHDAGPEWRFLTGSSGDIVAVQSAFDAYRGNKMGHVPTTFLRVSAADRWVRIDGLASAADLVAEYRRAVAK
jgi:protein SCO1/2